MFLHVTHQSQEDYWRKFRCVDDLCDFVRRLRLRQGNNIMRKGQWCDSFHNNYLLFYECQRSYAN